MSIHYLNIAWNTAIKPSSLKFVLVSLADYANEEGLAYPSIETLANRTAQDRKTVIKNLARLVELNLILDTGERRGKSGVVKVWKMLLEVVPKTGLSQKRDYPKNGTTSSTKNGTIPKTVLPTVKPHSDAALREVVPKTGLSQKRYSEPPVFNHQIEPPVIGGKMKNKKFKIPSVDEILAYCKSRNNQIDADRFFDHYESKGWMIGKNKMKNWQAAIRTWERNSVSRNSGDNSPIDPNDTSWFTEIQHEIAN